MGIILAFLTAIIGTVFQFLGPDKLKDMTNAIMEGLPAIINGEPVLGSVDFATVSRLGWILVFFYTTAAFLAFLGGFIMATITARVSMSLRSDVSNKIDKIPLGYFDKTSTGDIISRVTNDVDTIGTTLNQSVDGLIRALTMFIGSTVMMLHTNIIMAFAAIFSSFIGFGAMTLIMRVSQKHFILQQKGLGDVNGHIEEIYSALNIVKVYNGGRKAKETFEAINENLYDSGWRSQFLSGLMMPLMHLIGNFSYVSVCIAGAALVMNGSVTFGVIVAFMIYIRLFTQPLSQLSQSMQNLQRTAAASERVFEFLEEQELTDESNKTQKLSSVKGDVEFINVRFGYTKDRIIINDFTAKIKAGQKIAIVGPTGAGKTTMVNLLMRFYELNGGEIRIDGVPIHSITRENVHDAFCLVLQETWLFEGTIKENIIYNKHGVTDDQVKAAGKAVGIHHYIKSLPLGYDTIIKNGENISAGQRQLLTIARAMIQDAPLLILDEATSSVDTRTEHIVQDAMNKLTKGRTSFVIAHRLSTIKNADLILVMKDGDIIENGNHKKLLEQNGFYAELYNSQFEHIDN